MEKEYIVRIIKQALTALTLSFIVLILIFSATLFIYHNPHYIQEKTAAKTAIDKVQIGSDEERYTNSGLVAGEHVQLVINNCTSCHSAQLITQNRATREGWQGLIR